MVNYGRESEKNTQSTQLANSARRWSTAIPGLAKSELGVLVTVISPTIYPLASPHRPTYHVTPWGEVLCAKASHCAGENTFGSAGCNINHIRDAIAEADEQFGVAVTERDGRDIVVNTDTFLQ